MISLLTEKYAMFILDFTISYALSIMIDLTAFYFMFILNLHSWKIDPLKEGCMHATIILYLLQH